MATEDASYISELNAAYPADGDAVGEGGGTTTGTGSTRGHLNMIKYALKTQFSGLTGTTAITTSEAELNYVDGVTSAIQTQIDAKGVGDALLGTLQTLTKPQIPATQTATISTDVTLNFDTYQNFILTLGSGVNTLLNPTTEASNVGQTGVMLLIQPSSGAAGTLATGTDYETIGGTALTLSSTNSQYDVVPYMIKADNSILIGSPQLNFS